MAHTENTITAPVSIYDVQQVLGIGGIGDLGTIITQGNINKWAKYKPVVRPVVRLLTDVDRQAANYGLRYIPSWSGSRGSILNMLAFWLEENETEQYAPDCGIQSVYWQYYRPFGTISAPFRLADFAKDLTSGLGYFHDAEAPVQPIAQTAISMSPNGQLSIVYTAGAQDSRTLQLTDLKYSDGSSILLTGFYFGVALVRTGDMGAGKRYVITDVAATDMQEQGVHARAWFQNEASLLAFMGGASQQTFYIMPFLANDEIYDTFTRSGSTYRTFRTSLASLNADKFVALIQRQTISISISYAEILITQAFAYKNSSVSTRLIYYSATIRNGEQENRRSYVVTVELLDSSYNVLNTQRITGTLNANTSTSVGESIDSAGYYSGATYLRITADIDPSLEPDAIMHRSNTTVIDISLTPPTPDRED